mgnify:CR=1 FL=1
MVGVSNPSSLFMFSVPCLRTMTYEFARWRHWSSMERKNSKTPHSLNDLLRISRKLKSKGGYHFYPLPQSLPPGEGSSSETRLPRRMLRQVDSLNAGLQPFAAKLSANALKALEAKRSERLPLFSLRHSHAGKTHRSLNDLTWPFWITIYH